ncbi:MULTISPECIES: hypothetical protein [Bradyrhizobium]|jgi:hypothetical protein|uniref:Uncharacterized protein n=2 Tax=Nitrobacteraceae TaxID=41294 RepID=A0A810B6R0_9BRAD|nr:MULTISPECIES: hypothetical protein [Bradyrhizobium]MCS3933403.1 hypothetical protein [Bradyrhizobium elkanii]MBP1059655.1 hypothetical protein [Bradyrhizobium japonicum]MCS3958193.1 hypothetical protein [Bradyrhizobium japonicum]MCS3973960.1 hypothetical protein [Bradyrhizobium japonicum]WLB37484.1 hypothetical protein QIH78_40020 [Bradyrhizobium diazoefficiens]
MLNAMRSVSGTIDWSNPLIAPASSANRTRREWPKNQEWSREVLGEELHEGQHKKAAGPDCLPRRADCEPTMSVDDVPAEGRQKQSSDARGQQQKANQTGSAGVEANARRQDDANANNKKRR